MLRRSIGCKNLCVLVFAMLGACGLRVSAQASTVARGSGVSIQHGPTLRSGVQALPHIAKPVNAATARVNSAVDRLNKGMSAQLADCDSGYRVWARTVKDRRPDTRGDWERTVDVTMAGPGFVSYVATDETFCGGAHPNSYTMALVYDLNTGRPVNWLKLLKTGDATGELSGALDETKVGLLHSPKLHKLFAGMSDKECQEDLEEDSSGFALWPDASQGQIMFALPDLPHAIAACGAPMAMSASQATAMGLNAELTDALAVSHKRAVVKP